MKKWVCTVCGYVHDGDEAPDQCPKCGAAKEKFEAVKEEQSELISRARFTNHLHSEMLVVLEEMMDIAEAGLDDELDPGCVAIFSNAIEQGTILRQAIKAELKIHVNKGKWG